MKKPYINIKTRLYCSDYINIVECIVDDKVTLIDIDDIGVYSIIRYFREMEDERPKIKNIMDSLRLTSYQFYINNVLVDYSSHTKFYDITKDHIPEYIN